MRTKKNKGTADDAETGIPALPQKKKQKQGVRKPIRVDVVSMLSEWDVYKVANLQQPTRWSPRVPADGFVMPSPAVKENGPIILSKYQQLLSSEQDILSDDDLRVIDGQTISQLCAIFEFLRLNELFYPKWKKEYIKAALVYELVENSTLTADDRSNAMKIMKTNIVPRRRKKKSVAKTNTDNSSDTSDGDTTSASPIVRVRLRLPPRRKCQKNVSYSVDDNSDMDYDQECSDEEYSSSSSDSEQENDDDEDPGREGNEDDNHDQHVEDEKREDDNHDRLFDCDSRKPAPATVSKSTAQLPTNTPTNNTPHGHPEYLDDALLNMEALDDFSTGEFPAAMVEGMCQGLTAKFPNHGSEGIDHCYVGDVGDNKKKASVPNVIMASTEDDEMNAHSILTSHTADEANSTAIVSAAAKTRSTRSRSSPLCLPRQKRRNVSDKNTELYTALNRSSLYEPDSCCQCVVVKLREEVLAVMGWSPVTLNRNLISRMVTTRIGAETKRQQLHYCTVHDTIFSRTNHVGVGMRMCFGDRYAGMTTLPNDPTRMVRLFKKKGAAIEYTLLLILLQYGSNAYKDSLFPAGVNEIFLCKRFHGGSFVIFCLLTRDGNGDFGVKDSPYGCDARPLVEFPGCH